MEQQSELNVVNMSQLVAVLERIAVAIERLESPEAKAGRENKTQGEICRDDSLKSSHFFDYARENGLSSRYVHILARADIRSLDEVTVFRLEGVHRCGKKALGEILGWAQRMKSQQPNDGGGSNE